jgi:hypothetical protein
MASDVERPAGGIVRWQPGRIRELTDPDRHVVESRRNIDAPPGGSVTLCEGRRSG